MEGGVGKTMEETIKGPEISIIVPVYNAERFLEKCVDSILAQTFSDFELILVNDGSKDASAAICNRYAQADHRIKVIHQENKGVSVTRNTGIEQAAGRYLGFVDADDWIAEDMFAQMLTQAHTTQSDVVMCDAWTLYDNGQRELDTITQLETDCVLNRYTLTAQLLPDFAGSACRCIYKTDMIRKYGIRFPVGLKFSEDRVFNIYAMGYANQVSYIKKPLYMRYVNLTSCVHRFHPDYFEHALLAAEQTEKAVAEAWDNKEEYQTAYLKHLIQASLCAIENIKHPDSPYSRKERIQKIREICNNDRIREAIRRYGYAIPRVKLIMGRQVLALYVLNSGVYQKLDNVREVFRDGGIMGIIKKCISKIV